MFNEDSLDQLSFLLGRWSGLDASGARFYEAYERISPVSIIIQRYNDSSCNHPIDRSELKLIEGDLFSIWGEYQWRASKLGAGYIEFEPVNAPSSFSWRQVENAIIEAQHRWTDEKGAAWHQAITLKRFG